MEAKKEEAKLEAGSVLDSLYDKLLLRDLVGKVVPGITFVAAAVAGFGGPHLLAVVAEKGTAIMWTGVIGLAWLIGFALQGMGERVAVGRFKMLRPNPTGVKKRKKEAATTASNPSAGNAQAPWDGIVKERNLIRPLDSSNAWDRDRFYALWAEFQEIASPHEKIHAERLNVIKEGCGNAAVSLSCGGLFLAIGPYLRPYLLGGSGSASPKLASFVFAGMTFILAVFLQRMHVEHVERYGDFVLNTIARSQARAKQAARTDVANDVENGECPQGAPIAMKTAPIRG